MNLKPHPVFATNGNLAYMGTAGDENGDIITLNKKQLTQLKDDIQDYLDEWGEES